MCRVVLNKLRFQTTPQRSELIGMDVLADLAQGLWGGVEVSTKETADDILVLAAYLRQLSRRRAFNFKVRVNGAAIMAEGEIGEFIGLAWMGSHQGAGEK